ncbi:MAG TPA: flagella basal body P-ring formation protein FlgA [Terriglobales bacterium]|nr:flagella basal body P-ring formation protein FlgA [Terriglobales bacterium]
MKARRIMAVLGLALPLAATPGWAVRSHSIVSTAVVRLGDLCPAAALPGDAARAVLSNAPQPGIPLIWTRDQFAARLRAAGLPPAEFEIPVTVTVDRQAQAIPVAAVLTALNGYLHRELAPGDLRFTAPLTTAADPAVEVVSARRDAARDDLEVICRAQHDPQLLPFAVSVPLAPGDAARIAQEKLRRAAATAPREAEARVQPIVVRPGHPATLAISHPGFAITTTVEPLQAGRVGDRILVRNPGNHALLHVFVSGADRVSDQPENPHVD